MKKAVKRSAAKKAVRKAVRQEGCHQGAGQEGRGPSRPPVGANHIKTQIRRGAGSIEPLRGEFVCQVNTLVASALPM